MADNIVNTEVKVAGKKGKPKMVVDAGKFANALKTVEANGSLGNRSLLAKALAAEYNLTAASPITAAIVPLRLVEFNLTPVTPVGKRGRAAGTVITNAKTETLVNGLKNLFKLTDGNFEAQEIVLNLLAEIKADVSELKGVELEFVECDIENMSETEVKKVVLEAEKGEMVFA